MKLGLFIDYAASKITIPLTLVKRAEARGTRSMLRIAGDLQAGPHMQALMGGGMTAESLSASVKASAADGSQTNSSEKDAS